MTFHLIFDNNNMAGVTCGAGTAYPSGTSEFVPSFRGVSVVHVVIFYVDTINNNKLICDLLDSTYTKHMIVSQVVQHT